MAHNINQRVSLSCGLLALLVAVGGCQRGPTWNFVPVEGTITKDGRPLDGVKVVFLTDTETGAEGPRSIGMTDDAGRYHLRTDHGEEGVVMGKHRILIFDIKDAAKQRLRGMNRRPQAKETLKHLPAEEAKRLEEQMKKAATAKEEPPRVPRSYQRFSQTPLRVEVQSGPQVIDLEVK